MNSHDLLQKLADYMSEIYVNVSIRKYKIIVLERSDPYIIKLTKNGVKVRRWWNDIYLLTIVALLLFTLEAIILAITGLHLRQTTKFYIWLALMLVSTALIAHDNRCQRKIKAEILEKAQNFLLQISDNKE